MVLKVGCIIELPEKLLEIPKSRTYQKPITSTLLGIGQPTTVFFEAAMHTSLRTGLHYSNLILMWLEAKDSALSQSFTSKPSLPWSLRVDIWSTELFAPLLACLRLPVYSVKPWNWILVLWGLRGKEACRRTTRNYSDIKTLYIKWCTGRNGFHSAFAGMSHSLAKKTGWVWAMHSSQHMQLQPLFHWSSSNFHLFVQIFTSHVV